MHLQNKSLIYHIISNGKMLDNSAFYKVVVCSKLRKSDGIKIHLWELHFEENDSVAIS